MTGPPAGIAAAVAASTLLTANPFAPPQFIGGSLLTAHADPGATPARPGH